MYIDAVRTNICVLSRVYTYTYAHTVSNKNIRTIERFMFLYVKKCAEHSCSLITIAKILANICTSNAFEFLRNFDTIINI